MIASMINSTLLTYLFTGIDFATPLCDLVRLCLTISLPLILIWVPVLVVSLLTVVFEENSNNDDDDEFENANNDDDEFEGSNKWYRLYYTKNLRVRNKRAQYKLLGCVGIVYYKKKKTKVSLAPVEETSVEQEAPAEEVPVEEDPVEEAPAEEAPFVTYANGLSGKDDSIESWFAAYDEYLASLKRAAREEYLATISREPAAEPAAEPAPVPEPVHEPTPIPEPTEEVDGMDELMGLFANLSINAPAVDEPTPVEEPSAATHNNNDDSMDELLESFAKLSIQEPTYEAGATDIIEITPVEITPVEITAIETVPAENPFANITLTATPAAAFADFAPVEEIPAENKQRPIVRKPTLQELNREIQIFKKVLVEINAMRKEYDEIAPVIEEDYDYYNDPLAEEAFADMTFADNSFAEDGEDITIVAPVEIIPDPITEIPISAQKKKKWFRRFRKNSYRTMETATSEATSEQAAKKQKRGPIKGAIKKIGKAATKTGKAAKKGTKNVLNFIRQKKKSGAQEKSLH